MVCITSNSLRVSLSFSFCFLIDPASGILVQIAQEDSGPLQIEAQVSSPSVLTAADRSFYTGAFSGARAPLGSRATTAASALV